MNKMSIYVLIALICGVTCVASQQREDLIDYGKVDDNGCVLVSFPRSMTRVPQQMSIEYRWANGTNCRLPGRFMNRQQYTQVVVTGGGLDAVAQRNHYVATITLRALDETGFNRLKSQVPMLIQEAMLANGVNQIRGADQ